ncbi:MAG: NADH-quinone oxidoreductase subunit C [Myxococcota bacterium]|nr:NADH-quinone oxidoreductase subunit C [Myxococcota bacterium]
MEKVASRYPEALDERYVDRAGDAWGVVRPAALREVMTLLRNDPELQFRLFISADAVDRLNLPVPTPRFEVVYFLKSLKRNEHVRLKVRVDEDHATVPSVAPIFQGANWWERFIFDFYGISFEGHPDLRRILMYDEFKGHPLRKDYGLRERQPLVPERPIKDIFRGPGTNGPQ